MTSELGPVVFRGQDFEAATIPDSVGGISEDARLRATPIFRYEAVLYQQGPRYQFSGAFLFNGAGPNLNGDEGAWQFEVTEEVTEEDAGTERTLTIRGAEGDSFF